MELDKAMTDFLQQQGIFYKMFDVIRLVEQDGHYICKYLSDGSCTVTHENCYSFWGRDHRCSNCVSRQAYNENLSNANDAEEAISMADKTLYRCKQIVHHQ